MDSATLAHTLALGVQAFPDADATLGYFVMNLAGIGDTIPAWGVNPVQRDRELRAFYPSEPWLASTVASLAGRNAAFSWTVEGGSRTASAVQDMLHNADYGKGWIRFVHKLSIDLYTADNGAFIEIIRAGESEIAPVIGIAHLDAGRCTRSGNPFFPVLYTDQKGGMHRLAWYQVVDLTDAPSPVETMNGMQHCAVSRVLLTAQILRDVAQRDHEKLTGRFAGALHLVSGINQKMLDDVFARHNSQADKKGLTRYVQPIIAGTLDPNAKIAVETIELSSLPEGYDEEKKLKWYIAVLALGFQVEYQDLAPLPGGGLGTSTQSQTLHLKAKGKGPELFRKLLEHALNFHVLPQNVNFRFTEEDVEAKGAEASYRELKAKGRKLDIDSGILTPKVARQIMVDEGDLKQEYLAMLEQGDAVAAQEAQAQADAAAQAAAVQAQTLGDQATQTGATPTDVTLGDQATGKALTETDYWGRQRGKMEEQATEEFALALGSMSREVLARIRREANAT